MAASAQFNQSPPALGVAEKPVRPTPMVNTLFSKQQYSAEAPPGRLSGSPLSCPHTLRPHPQNPITQLPLSDLEAKDPIRYTPRKPPRTQSDPGPTTARDDSDSTREPIPPMGTVVLRESPLPARKRLSTTRKVCIVFWMIIVPVSGLAATLAIWKTRG